MIRKTPSMKPFLPSPGEVRSACLQIRREWSPRERESRRIGGQHAWRMLVHRFPVFVNNGNLEID